MNKLDLLDKKILFELDLNSRQTYNQLAKKLKVAKETIAFRVKRLVKENYIKNFITTTNTANLNRFYYKLFYKFHKTTPNIDKEIVDYIKQYPNIAYFASLEGRYDITFLVLSKNMQDLYNFLIPFREKFGEYILEQELLQMPQVHRFNYRFFNKGQLQHTKYPSIMSEPKIDELDYKIINELAKNARIPLIDLAKQTNSETNVIKYRINKLKHSDILGSHVLDINFEKFGLQLIQVDFTLKNHSVIDKLIEFSSHIPSSTFATVTLGKYDLAVEFALKDLKELKEILDQIKEQFSDDITNHEVFIMHEHKVNWFPLRK